MAINKNRKRSVRLLLWADCERSCEGCCNKHFDLGALPVATGSEIENADEILLTGGEPMLYPAAVLNIIRGLKEKAPNAKIILYTAELRKPLELFYLMCFLDGLTVTVHAEPLADSDAERFLHDFIIPYGQSRLAGTGQSLRLNIFKGVYFPIEKHSKLHAVSWKIKRDIEWLTDCPLPPDEIFRRI